MQVKVYQIVTATFDSYDDDLYTDVTPISTDLDMVKDMFKGSVESALKDAKEDADGSVNIIDQTDYSFEIHYQCNSATQVVKIYIDMNTIPISIG